MKELTTSSLRLLALGTLMALPLAGCDNEAGQARNQAERQLEEAARKIQTHALTEAYPTPMTDEQSASLSSAASQAGSGSRPDWMTDEQAQRLATLNASNFQPMEDAKSELTAVQTALSASGGDQALNEQKAAKAALRAESNLALSRLRLEEANRSDSRLQQQISLAAAHIDAILELQSIAAANAAYDPSAPLRQIENQAQEARTRLSRHQAEVRDLQKKINDLQARIDAEVRETNRLGEQAAKQREAALAAPLDGRIAKIEAAAAVARKADAHQVAAAQLESQVDVLEPDLVRAQTFVLEAEGELSDLDAARARIKAREQEVAAESTQLQADVRKATEAFNAVYQEISNQFESELMPRYDAAREAADAALRDARSAGGRSSRAPKAQQALGQVLWRESMSIDSFAQFVRRVAENSQALGRSGQDAAAADALDVRANEARAGAEAALREALDAIPETGRSEEETSSNQRLASMIRESLEYITGRAVAEVRDLTDLAEVLPTMDEPTVAQSAEGPLGLLRQMKSLAEAGRIGDTVSLFHAASPAQEAMMTQVGGIVRAFAKLDEASRSQFGVGFKQLLDDAAFGDKVAELASGNPMAGVVAMMLEQLSTGLIDLSDVDLDSVEIMFDGAGTTAWTDDIPAIAGMNMVLINDAWMFELPSFGEDAQLDASQAAPIVTAIENVVSRTNAGEFPDKWLMISALLDELSRAFMPQGTPDSGGVGRQRNRGGGG